MYKTICSKCNKISEMDSETYWYLVEQLKIKRLLGGPTIDGIENCEIKGGRQ